MKKRLTALLLILTLLTGMLLPCAAAEEADPGAENPAQTEESSDLPDNSEEKEPESENSQPADGSTEPTENKGEDPETDVPKENPDDSEENLQGEEQAEPSEETPEESPAVDPEAAESEKPTAELAYEDASITLSYDDYYDFSELQHGSVLAELKTLETLSYQVSGGSVTELADEAVLELDASNENGLHACGVGTAEILLVAAEQLELARRILEEEPYEGEESVTVPVLRVTVTVVPATLTVMLLAGQSNMEGYCSASLGYQQVQSVLCERGQVYSTYAPKNDKQAVKISGISSLGACTTANAEDFVPAALGSNTLSLGGSELVYPLDALTENGIGKTGPDSGLAYEWNRLTGEKVWTINTAAGSSGIANWAQGGECYERAMAVYGPAMETYRAELAAGHYEQGHILLFWMQGESDRYNSAEYYINYFNSMYSGMKNAFGVEYCGMISVRCAISDNGNIDLEPCGQRLAQYYMAADGEHGDVYIVSNVNEQWIVNPKAYFQEAYPEGYLDYPMRDGASTKLPANLSAIHSDIHYTQVGHNENGITAARGMLDVMQGTIWPESADVLNSSGKLISTQTYTEEPEDENGESVTVPAAVCAGNVGTGISLLVRVAPASAAKYTYFDYDSAELDYDAVNGMLYPLTAGSHTLKLRDAAGNLLLVITVNATVKTTAPTIRSICNTANGIQFTINGSTTGSFYIYRKIGSSSKWDLSTPYAIIGCRNTYLDTNVEPGLTYVYMVRADTAGGLSSYNSKGTSCTRLEVPQLQQTVYSSGTKLSWSSIAGAKSYNIYRRESTTSNWAKIGSSSKTTYTDNSGKNGVRYYYTVEAVNSSSRSAKNEVGVFGMKTGKPKLLSISNETDGILFTWQAVPGAEAYNVYRRSGSAKNWSDAEIFVVTGTEYLDTEAQPGETFVYTARPLAEGSIIGDVDKTGKKMTRVLPTEMESACAENGTVLVSWYAAPAADQYKLYRRTENGSWASVGQTKELYYKDTSAKQGVVYYYSVRAVKNGCYSGLADNALPSIRLAAAKMSTIKNMEYGVQFSWQAVNGAEEYEVYRRLSTEKWGTAELLGVTDELSWLDADAQAGLKYVYTVRPVSGENTGIRNNTGLTILRIDQPQLLTLEPAATGKGYTVTWLDSSGAKTYKVYRKAEGAAKWTALTTVNVGKATSYTDKTAKSGVVYYYTVRAYNGSQCSSYDPGLRTDYLY